MKLSLISGKCFDCFTKLIVQYGDFSLSIKKNLNHWCPQLKLKLVLLLSSFVHNSSANEHKNMKLREKIILGSLIGFYIIGTSEKNCN